MKDVMKKIIKLSGILGLVITFGGCAGMTDTQQRAVTGSAIGAAGGRNYRGHSWKRRDGSGHRSRNWLSRRLSLR